MKKLIVTLTALATLTMSLMAVSASETEVSSTNMDADTYIDLRTDQLDEALTNGDIDQETYDALLEHILENASEGSFGRGPQGYLTSDDEDCVLDEAGSLGIFRNENSGMRNGRGNGMGTKAADGTGLGYGNSGNGRNGSGDGTSTGSGAGINGLRLQDGSNENEDCILD